MEWLKAARFVDWPTLALKEDELENAAIENGLATSTAELRQALASTPDSPTWEVARGHDMVDIIVIALRRVLGSLPASRGAKDVAHSLRVSMEWHQLSNLRLGADIRSWEAANRAYRVLDWPDEASAAAQPFRQLGGGAPSSSLEACEEGDAE